MEHVDFLNSKGYTLNLFLEKNVYEKPVVFCVLYLIQMNVFIKQMFHMLG